MGFICSFFPLFIHSFIYPTRVRYLCASCYAGHWGVMRSNTGVSALRELTEGQQSYTSVTHKPVRAWILMMREVKGRGLCQCGI